MGHRHLISSSQMFENENDQGWNHTDQPYMHMARPGAPEDSFLLCPPDNVTVDGGHFTAQRNLAPRSTHGYSSSGLNIEMPRYQPQVPGPSRDPFLHPSAVGSLDMVQENYARHASSSNHGGQNFHGVDGGFFELSMGNGRGPYKRKGPGILQFVRGAKQVDIMMLGVLLTIPFLQTHGWISKVPILSIQLGILPPVTEVMAFL